MEAAQRNDAAIGRSLSRSSVFTAALLAFAAASHSQAGNVTLTEGTNLAVSASPTASEVVIDLHGRLWRLGETSAVAKPLTNLVEDARRPAWSPDGKQIAYQSHAEDNWQIRVLDADSGDIRELTTGPFDHREPAWHPSGSRLALSSDRSGDYGIWQLDRRSGLLQQLTTGPGDEFEPSWSGDGDWLAYVSRDTSGYSLELLKTGEEPVTLHTSKNVLAAPSWRPDGSVITFVERNRYESVLKMLILSDPPVVKTVSRNEDVFPFPVSWRDREHLFYTSDGLIRHREFGERISNIIPFAATVEFSEATWKRRAYDFDDSTPRPARGSAGLDVLGDGSVVAAMLGDLWVLDTNAAPRPLVYDEFVDAHPNVAPDGNQIVFISDRGGSMQLWLLDRDSGRLRSLTRDAYAPFYPVFSPDGAEIAYLDGGVLNTWGRASLKVVHLESRKSRLLASELNGPGMPVWSPDGSAVRIAVVEPGSGRFREGRHGFVSIPVSDTAAPARPLAVAVSSRGLDGPDLSPDGARLTYSSDGKLGVSPTADSGVTVLLTDELAAMPRWNPDGGSITYLGAGEIRRLSASGGSQHANIPAPVFRAEVPDERITIRAGRLYDGVVPEYRHGVDIVVSGNRIESLAATPGGSPDVDASRWTAIPGLIDMHVHQSAITGERLGRIWLAHGITAVRETGSDPYDALERKESWASGRRLGPRQFFAGRLMDGGRVFYSQATTVTNSERVRREIDLAQRLDFDLVKTYVRLPDRWQSEIVQAAHAAGLPVSSHELLPAAALGADGIEHLAGTSRHGYSTKLSLLNRSYQDVIDVISATGITLTPTLALQGGMAHMALRGHPILEASQYTALYSSAERSEFTRMWRRFFGANATELELRLLPTQQTIARIVAAGGRVAAGTDAPFVPYGLSLHAELSLLVDAGLQPFQALRAASWEAARWLGVESDLGTLEPGKLADFVLVEGDPLRNVGDALQVRAVVSNGRFFFIDALVSPAGP